MQNELVGCLRFEYDVRTTQGSNNKIANWIHLSSVSENTSLYLYLADNQQLL